MSTGTTTDILFNSPALKSLQRDQLVKLCKIHSIKASGKNLELIHRLKQHAQSLPRDSPLSVAIRSEGFDDISTQGLSTIGSITSMPGFLNSDDKENQEAGELGGRLSDQWTLMEAIDEERTYAQGTTSSSWTLAEVPDSVDEFGTTSTKVNSVGTSIKTFATSFGLKHPLTPSTPSKRPLLPFSNESLERGADDLTQQSIPYSELPPSADLLQTDHLTFTPPRMDRQAAMKDEAVPGSALRPGVSAPENARLSLGLDLDGDPATPITTIRLVHGPSASLDLSPAYGGGNNVAATMATSTSYAYSGTPRLKPFKTAFDLVMATPGPDNEEGSGGRLYPKLPSPFNFEQMLPSPAKCGDNLMEIDSEGGGEEDDELSIPGGFDYTPTKHSSTSLLHKTFKHNQEIERAYSVTSVVGFPASNVDSAPQSETDKNVPMVTEVSMTEMTATAATDADMTVIPNTPADDSKPKSKTASPSPPERFVFGSTLPQNQVSDNQFKDVAASVLVEMNARLAKNGVAPVNLSVLSATASGSSGASGQSLGSGAIVSQEERARRMMMGLPGIASENKHRFEKAHEGVFKKMESIEEVYKRKRVVSKPGQPAPSNKEPVKIGKKRKSTVFDQDDDEGSVGVKRKENGVGSRVGKTSGKTQPVVQSNTRVKGASRGVVPGEGDDRGGKRARMDPSSNSHSSGSHGVDVATRDPTTSQKKATMHHRGQSADEDDKEANGSKQKEKRKETIKKKLDVSKAMRRSGIAAARASRASVGGNGKQELATATAAEIAKPKGSRFAFLSKAKNAVASVWNRGKNHQPTSQLQLPPSAAVATKPSLAPAVVPTANVPSGSGTSSAAVAEFTDEANCFAPEETTSRDTATETSTAQDQMNNEKKAATLPLDRRAPKVAAGGAGNTRSLGAKPSSLRLPSALSSFGTAKDKGKEASTKTTASAIPRARSPISSIASGVSKIGRGATVPSGSQRPLAAAPKRATPAVAGPSNLTAKKENGAASGNGGLKAPSRLLMPTASSIAKTSAPLLSPTNASGSSLPRLKAREKLPVITTKSNGISKDAEGGERGKSPVFPTPTSPRPLEVPLGSRIPAPTRPGGAVVIPEADAAASGTSNTGEADEGNGEVENDGEEPRARTRTESGRKPRISRSKVIAKLAQRTAGKPPSSAGAKKRNVVAPPSSPNGGKTRSSLGAQGKSAIVKGGSKVVAHNDVLMSAKKRAMQNEYAKRKGKAAVSGLGSGPMKAGDQGRHVSMGEAAAALAGDGDGDGMEVDV